MAEDRISRRARILAVATTVLMILVPITALIALGTGSIDADTLRATYGVTTLPDDIGTGPTFVWITVEAVRMALFLWLLWLVRSWLRACASGQVFAGHTARQVQRIGAGLLALAAAHIVGNTIIIAALTWNNPPGERSLAIGFGSADCLMLLAAGLMTLFGWIHAEAARLSAENEGFV
ncbi:hypothetical protein [Tateyamaria sp. SN6-1]|uniref:hypothetical protein n=1 Tax=Tateyamaria sp. SN6-1 TaxID=3092148 RepID=UPI0039F47BFE